MFIEQCFPEVMQRHLSGAHTHLFTASSLAYLCREFGMTSIAEWWFGTDIPDLVRAMSEAKGTQFLHVPNLAGWINHWLLKSARMQSLVDVHNLTVMKKVAFRTFAERFALDVCNSRKPLVSIPGCGLQPLVCVTMEAVARHKFALGAGKGDQETSPPLSWRQPNVLQQHAGWRLSPTW